MTRLAFIALTVLLLAGCSTPHYHADKAEPGAMAFSDEEGDTDPRFDLLSAELKPLNGSIALRARIKNYNDGIPFIEGRLDLHGQTFYARLVKDDDGGSYYGIRAEDGRLEGARHLDPRSACWFPSLPSTATSSAPWWILLEFLHNRTGLENGGHADRLIVRSLDEDGTIKDEIDEPLDIHFSGGPNPYASSSSPCPLVNERGNVS